MVSRSLFIKLSSISAALPLLSLVKPISPASAAVMVKVRPDDPAAIALKYLEVARAAVRTDKIGVPGSKQTCSNCRFYKDSETPEWRGCTSFQNWLVVKAGWYMGWIPAA